MERNFLCENWVEKFGCQSISNEIGDSYFDRKIPHWVINMFHGISWIGEESVVLLNSLVGIWSQASAHWYEFCIK